MSSAAIEIRWFAVLRLGAMNIGFHLDPALLHRTQRARLRALSRQMQRAGASGWLRASREKAMRSSAYSRAL